MVPFEVLLYKGVQLGKIAEPPIHHIAHTVFQSGGIDDVPGDLFTRVISSRNRAVQVPVCRNTTPLMSFPAPIRRRRNIGR